MNKSKYVFTVIALVMFLVFVFGFMGFSPTIYESQATAMEKPLLFVNGGFIDDGQSNQERLRIVDYEYKQTFVPEGVYVQSNVHVANYDTIERSFGINPNIKDQNIGCTAQIKPELDNNITLQPGEERVYSFFVKFVNCSDPASGNSNITMGLGAGANESTVNLTVIQSGSHSDGSFIFDRGVTDTKTNTITNYKDATAGKKDSIGLDLNMPPVSRDLQGVSDVTVDDYDDVDLETANGTLTDFLSIRDGDRETHGTIVIDDFVEPNVTVEYDPKINVGFFYGQLNRNTDYAFDIGYNYSADQMSEIEAAIVKSDGTEIDEDTEYMLPPTGSTVDSANPREITIRFSEEEIAYARQQGQVYLELRNSTNVSEDIEMDIHYLDLISADDTWTAENRVYVKNISANYSSGTTSGEIFTVTAALGNRVDNEFGQSSDSFVGELDVVETTGAYDRNIRTLGTRIVNPGETRRINFTLRSISDGAQEFKLLDSTFSVNTNENQTASISGVTVDGDESPIAYESNEYVLDGLSSQEKEAISNYEWFVRDLEAIVSGNEEADITFVEPGAGEVVVRLSYDDGSGVSTYTQDLDIVAEESLSSTSNLHYPSFLI